MKTKAGLARTRPATNKVAPIDNEPSMGYFIQPADSGTNANQLWHPVGPHTSTFLSKSDDRIGKSEKGMHNLLYSFVKPCSKSPRAFFFTTVPDYGDERRLRFRREQLIGSLKEYRTDCMPASWAGSVARGVHILQNLTQAKG